MREKWATMTVVGGVAVGLLLYLVVYSVRVDQIAVHKRFSKVIRVVQPRLGAAGEEVARMAEGAEGVKVDDTAGWFLKLPWPFDQVDKHDQKIQLVDGPLAQIQLADEYQLIPRVYATWRLRDAVAFEKSLKGDMDSAEQRLKEIIGDQTATVFGKRRLRDVVNTDPGQLKFEDIEQEIFEGVRATLAGMKQTYGLEVTSLGITWIALPQATTSAVFERMAMERARWAEKHRAEGESDKQMKIAEADAARKTLLAEAGADAKRIRAAAETEAAQYYDVFAMDPDLAVMLRRLDALKSITQTAAEKGQPMTFVLTHTTPPFGVLGGAFLGEHSVGEGAGEGASAASGQIQGAPGAADVREGQ